MDTMHCTAFEGSRCIASGGLKQVALKTKEVVDRGEGVPVLIFDDLTGRPVEMDFRGTVEDVRKRLAGMADEGGPDIASGPPEKEMPRRPGRPKLGVVAREVTLLPRHWEWLNNQRGGASVALRKLVEDARRASSGKDRVRQSQDAAYRFMSAMAGNLSRFEDAARALFAGDRGRFDDLVGSWPADVRDHAKKLAALAFQGEATTA